MLYCIVGFAILIPLFYFEEDWSGKRAWNHFERQSEAAGERFDQSALDRYSGPDDQNFALAPIVVSSYARFLDKNGRVISSSLTNVVDRLRMSLYREDLPPRFEIRDPFTGPTNLSNWRYSKFTDLGAWQHYFRDPPRTKYIPPHYRVYSGRFAARYGRPPPDRDVEPLPPTNGFPVAPHPQTPAADVLLALSRYDSAIEELRQATLLPRSSFPFQFDPEKPTNLVLNGGGRLLDCAEVLGLRSVAELNLGRTADALQDVLMGLRLAETATNEILKWTLWDSGVINMTLQPIWEGLANHQWSDSQLRSLDNELAKFDFLAQYARQVRENRTLELDEIEYMRKTHNSGIISAESCDDNDFGMWLGKAYFHAFPEGWYYRNELAVGRHSQQVLSQIDLKNRIASADDERGFGYPWPGVAALAKPYVILAATTVREVPAIQYAYTQTCVDLARVACATERYHLSCGDYPKSLDLLTPQYITALPHDIITGQPLRYHAENSRMLIYSIGWDKRDDHGAVARNRWRGTDITSGDWAFRFK